jgi:hypothetical protein
MHTIREFSGERLSPEGSLLSKAAYLRHLITNKQYSIRTAEEQLSILITATVPQLLKNKKWGKQCALLSIRKTSKQRERLEESRQVRDK